MYPTNAITKNQVFIINIDWSLTQRIALKTIKIPEEMACSKMVHCKAVVTCFVMLTLVVNNRVASARPSCTAKVTIIAAARLQTDSKLRGMQKHFDQGKVSRVARRRPCRCSFSHNSTALCLPPCKS